MSELIDSHENTNLSSRVLMLIDCQTMKQNRFKQMEVFTKIPSDRWKALALGRQRPTAEMIEALARKWPHYAFWLATGISDSLRGHCEPGHESTRQIYAEREWLYRLERVGLCLDDDKLNQLEMLRRNEEQTLFANPIK